MQPSFFGWPNSRLIWLADFSRDLRRKKIRSVANSALESRSLSWDQKFWTWSSTFHVLISSCIRVLVYVLKSFVARWQQIQTNETSLIHLIKYEQVTRYRYIGSMKCADIFSYFPVIKSVTVYSARYAITAVYLILFLVDRSMTEPALQTSLECFFWSCELKSWSWSYCLKFWSCCWIL